MLVNLSLTPVLSLTHCGVARAYVGASLNRSTSGMYSTAERAHQTVVDREGPVSGEGVCDSERANSTSRIEADQKALTSCIEFSFSRACSGARLRLPTENKFR